MAANYFIFKFYLCDSVVNNIFCLTHVNFHFFLMLYRADFVNSYMHWHITINFVYWCLMSLQFLHLLFLLYSTFLACIEFPHPINYFIVKLSSFTSKCTFMLYAVIKTGVMYYDAIQQAPFRSVFIKLCFTPSISTFTSREWKPR